MIKCLLTAQIYIFKQEGHRKGADRQGVAMVTASIISLSGQNLFVVAAVRSQVGNSIN